MVHNPLGWHLLRKYVIDPIGVICSVSLTRTETVAERQLFLEIYR